jgi:hypothetical protein
MPEPIQQLTDPNIPTLAEVFDTIVLANHLRSISLYNGNEGDVKEVQIIRVLKHHLGRRCTLEIRLRTDKGWRSLIAKIYRKDRSDVFQAMKGIQQAGFGLRDEFSISQPVAYLSSLRCLVLEKVEGTTADEIFKTGDERSRAVAAERCALWLARFHALAPKVGPISHACDHLNSSSMQRCAREMAKQGGSFADRGAQLFQRLETASASLGTVELCPSHGSYGASQVMLAQGRTAGFDLDRYCVADPAHDLGRFLGALRRWALDKFGSIRALDGAAEIFRKSYMAVGQPDAERNLRFFEAAACLKWAKHILSQRALGWHDNADVMLNEGLTVLDGEAA